MLLPIYEYTQMPMYLKCFIGFKTLGDSRVFFDLIKHAVRVFNNESLNALIREESVETNVF